MNILGGMYLLEDGQQDINLTNYFKWGLLEYRRSNFVSTVSSLRCSVMHTSSLDHLFRVDELLINAPNSYHKNSLKFAKAITSDEAYN
jgi:hypothetical protein